MRYRGRDSRSGEVAFDQEKSTSPALQAKLDSINHEHGGAYIEGIQSRFDILKARHFDPSWNWFVETLCLCTMPVISFLVGLPPSIKKSPRVALPSLIELTLTCFNSCGTISISAMLQGRDLLTSDSERVWSIPPP
jgi:hypothetical protein